MSLLYVPFFFQGAVMAVDEFYFHERRDLPLWERVGHPLDSLTTFITLLIPVLLSFDSFSQKLFLSFAIFSCFFITKDEFIHSGKCSGVEHWLHALLFILHPLIFMATYLLWINNPESLFLRFQLYLVAGFMVYQIVRWNVYGKNITNK
jgi:hypothetical protein